MRLPNPSENLIGKICVCSVGRPGIVTSKKKCKFESSGAEFDAWVGLGLDGKGNWCSTSPAIIAESAEEFRQRLSTRFGGKMSFNS